DGAITKYLAAGGDASNVSLLMSQATLAAALRELGRHAESMELLEGTVVPGLERSLGPGHPDVLQAKINLAVVCADVGDFGRAIDMQRQVVEAADEVLGQ